MKEWTEFSRFEMDSDVADLCLIPANCTIIALYTFIILCCILLQVSAIFNRLQGDSLTQINSHFDVGTCSHLCLVCYSTKQLKHELISYARRS